MEAYIKIAGLENMLEAQLVESILKEKKIPTGSDRFTTRPMTDCFSSRKAGGKYTLPRNRKTPFWIFWTWSELTSDHGV